MSKPKKAQAPAQAAPIQVQGFEPAAEETQPGDETSDRRTQVKQTIGQLYTLVKMLAETIYQITLKDEQIRELTQNILKELSKTIGEVTDERVKQIAQEYLVIEAMKKCGRAPRFSRGDRAAYIADPFTQIPCTVDSVGVSAGVINYNIRLEPIDGVPHILEDVSGDELAEI